MVSGELLSAVQCCGSQIGDNTGVSALWFKGFGLVRHRDWGLGGEGDAYQFGDAAREASAEVGHPEIAGCVDRNAGRAVDLRIVDDFSESLCGS